MLKFKFNYLNNTLAYQKHETWYELGEDSQFEGNFGSQGFNLTDGWITFNIYEYRIRAFYKQVKEEVGSYDFWEPQNINYFRKDLAKECPVIFTFSDQDEVEKIGNKWIKKGGKYAH